METLPELKQILGAMLFVARQPLALEEIRRVLERVGEEEGGIARDFARVGPPEISRALDELRADLERAKTGLHLAEVAHGYRLENDACCGLWLRCLLDKSKPARLSRPALETLAIIAYRQPCVRSEIEAVRGVAVDQILRNLMEMQLIRVTGRSTLPGRPWQYGTTQLFLEHFGLKSLDDLPGIDELRRLEAEQLRRRDTPTEPTVEPAGEGGPVASTAAEDGEEMPGGGTPALAADAGEDTAGIDVIEDDAADDDDEEDDGGDEEEEEQDGNGGAGAKDTGGPR